MDLAQREAAVFEVVRVTGRGAVPHVAELPLRAVCAHVEEFFRNRRVENEVSVEEPDN